MLPRLWEARLLRDTTELNLEWVRNRVLTGGAGRLIQKLGQSVSKGAEMELLKEDMTSR